MAKTRFGRGGAGERLCVAAGAVARAIAQGVDGVSAPACGGWRDGLRNGEQASGARPSGARRHHEDPSCRLRCCRRPWVENRRHDPGALLLKALVSGPCGATSRVGMAAFGRARKSVFKGFPKLTPMIPAQGNRRRVAAINAWGGDECPGRGSTANSPGLAPGCSPRHAARGPSRGPDRGVLAGLAGRRHDGTGRAACRSPSRSAPPDQPRSVSRRAKSAAALPPLIAARFAALSRAGASAVAKGSS